MLASERRLYIQSSLEEKGIVSLKEIAKELGIAEITVRRDFEKMEADGQLKRVQGGAMLDDTNAELTMRRKIAINASAKAKVAMAAAGVIEEGDCIFVDAGTSTAPMIDWLCDKRITIVTYSELLIKRINKPMLADIYMVGGKYIPGFSIYTGRIAQENLKKYHFNKAFFSCTGVELKDERAYVSDQDSIEMKNIAMENAESAYLLIDTSKLNRKSLLPFSALDQFDSVFCDMADEISKETIHFNNFQFVE